MALSPPQPFNGQRVLRISGLSDSITTGSAGPGDGSMAPAQAHAFESRIGRSSLMGTRRIRVATWNIGSLTGKCSELAEVLQRRRVHVACIQETKWKGSKAREIGNGYRLFYHGTGNTRNGVGIVLDREFSSMVVDVKRISDRLMIIRLVVDGGRVSVVSAYAPQVGCSDEEKMKFWEMLEQALLEIPKEEKVIIGADLNGHVGKDRKGFMRQHGGWGYGARNEGGEEILKVAQAYDLAIVNTFFQKKEEHLITFKSGPSKSQIDFFLVRREELKGAKDCKVIPGESLTAQHRVLVMDFRIAVVKKRRPQRDKKKIRWWRMKEAEGREFGNKLVEKCKQLETGERNPEES